MPMVIFFRGGAVLSRLQLDGRLCVGAFGRYLALICVKILSRVI